MITHKGQHSSSLKKTMHPSALHSISSEGSGFNTKNVLDNWVTPISVEKWATSLLTVAVNHYTGIAIQEPFPKFKQRSASAVQHAQYKKVLRNKKFPEILCYISLKSAASALVLLFTKKQT